MDQLVCPECGNDEFRYTEIVVQRVDCTVFEHGHRITDDSDPEILDRDLESEYLRCWNCDEELEDDDLITQEEFEENEESD